MTGQPKWMPSEDTMRAIAHNCDLYAVCGNPDPMADFREVIEEAVAKALAEREARHREDLRVITEATRMAADKRAERHKREVIEARIEELRRQACVCEDEEGEKPFECYRCKRLDTLRAELAALDKEVKP